ncbi:MAG: hypothetical protein ACUVQ6_08005 [Dissulfurimicrobium sp.]|uniref:hypothetical protein n=1 Tax=Dissulfurimicrobium sp. TaxID=2022436 RepID=UPI0040497764
MDWQFIAEHLRTEEILSHLAGLDPLSLASDFYVAAPFLIVMAVLVFFKMIRTAATILSVVALWFAIAYTLPKTEIISIKDLGVFIGVCTAILVVLIYVYLIRSD